MQCLRYAQFTAVSLLQHFYKCMRQFYTSLHTCIAFSRRCIIGWRRQGASFLAYYDTLVEMRTLRDWSMQQLTKPLLIF